jgi:hypothetical protein
MRGNRGQNCLNRQGGLWYGARGGYYITAPLFRSIGDAGQVEEHEGNPSETHGY